MELDSVAENNANKGQRVLQRARRRRIQLLAKTLKGPSTAELDVLLRAAELMERAARKAAVR